MFLVGAKQTQTQFFFFAPTKNIMDFKFAAGNNDELAKLNQYLSKNAYIEGFGPTLNDVKIFSLVPRSISAATFPHVVRWATNIGSFPPRVRARWSKGKVTLDDHEEKKANQGKKASKKGSDKPEKKESKKDSKKNSQKDSKKDKKNKKDKKAKKAAQEEEPAAIEEEPVSEEAAVEEAPAEEVAEEAAAEEVPVEEAAEEVIEEAEEPVEDDANMSLDDLVADDDEDDEETKAMFAKQKDLMKDIQARQAANAGKAKSNLTLDVKPFDSETDMHALEAKIRKIEIEGMKWLGGTLIDVAYGIKKLRIMCQLVDVLVNPDTVREEIEKFEEEVQSTDVFAFQMA